MNRSEVEQLFRRMQADTGRINGIVDIVGMATLKPLSQFTDSDWNWQFDAVLRHTFLALQLGAPVVAEAGGGPIIFVGSISGDLCVPAETVYGSAKAAQHHLVRSAALEYAPQKLRINAVSPGFTRTPRLLQLFGPASWQQIDRAVPVGAAATPAEVASVILFLASDLGRHILGQVITVDGGLSKSGTFPPLHPRMPLVDPLSADETPP
jgi:NAD(P)-dependent dehydrogenase (short-subunit alcohol dehydrogenase family)